MTKDQIVARAQELISLAKTAPATAPSSTHALSGALTLMTSVYGDNSQQVKALLDRRDFLNKGKVAWTAIDAWMAASVVGAMENLVAEVNAGLLGSVERRVTSDVLSDFIQLARASLAERNEEGKNVAAVLAAAAFEDTLRRIAREHAGVIGRDPLADVLVALKNSGLLVSPQLGIANGYLNFRNLALHADWDGIEPAAVESIIGFVEQLLLKHFVS